MRVLNLGLLLLATIGSITTCASCGSTGSTGFVYHDDPTLNGRKIAECRVSLQSRYAEASIKNGIIELCAFDKDAMQELILTPIEKAMADPSPAAYRVAGNMEIVRRDGSRELYTLFHPWGHIARHDNDQFVYLITDLSGLRQAFKKSLTVASMDVERLERQAPN